ncbi:hypothetical protein ACFQ07_26980, partial [Actinomadura adrarensis]
MTVHSNVSGTGASSGSDPRSRCCRLTLWAFGVPAVLVGDAVAVDERSTPLSRSSPASRHRAPTGPLVDCSPPPLSA